MPVHYLRAAPASTLLLPSTRKKQFLNWKQQQQSTDQCTVLIHERGCCSCSEITGNGEEKKNLKKKNQESVSKAVPTPAGTDVFSNCRPQASAWKTCQRVHIVRKYSKGSILARNRKFSKVPSILSPATSCSSGMRTGRSFYISKNINKYFSFLKKKVPMCLLGHLV